MKDTIYDLIAWLWFAFVVLWSLLFMIFVIIMIVFSNIGGMLKSGFSVPAMGFAFCFMIGIPFAITGLVPVFRRCYYLLPWLYPFTMTSMMNLYIISIAEAILSKGFKVMGTSRHVITVILVIIQVILCRGLMCWYLKKNPMILRKYDRTE